MSQFVYSVTPPQAIEFKRITPDCIDDVVFLLQERNQTLPAYTHWKYGNSGRHWTGGVIAYAAGEPLGCFGLISRRLVCKDGTELDCGWFADWYVRRNRQGTGIGTLMLQELKQYHPVIFGHPGPISAHQICLSNGYRTLGFQSRRRVVILPLAYEWLKTRYKIKAFFQLILARSYTLYTVLNAHWHVVRQVANHPAPTGNWAHFDEANAYGKWILDQPVVGGIRKTGIWRGTGLEVVFVDDIRKSGLKRRLILFTSGRDRFSIDTWRQFVQGTRAAGCMILEMFTTEFDLDHLWARLGAVHVSEPPILVTGLPSSIGLIALHGCDRENWTYLASTS